MKTSRYTEAQIIAILRQAEGGVPVAELCREMALNAVARRGAIIALACRAFGVSETCYRYGPKLTGC